MTSKLLNYDLNVNDRIHVPLLINFIENLGAVKNPGRYPYIEEYNISDVDVDYVIENASLDTQNELEDIAEEIDADKQDSIDPNSKED